LEFVKEDEIEGVCSEIRQAVGRTSLLHSNLNVKVNPRLLVIVQFDDLYLEGYHVVPVRN
jgi:hypothetical protein